MGVLAPVILPDYFLLPPKSVGETSKFLTLTLFFEVSIGTIHVTTNKLFKKPNPSRTTPYPPMMDAHLTGREIITKAGLCEEY